LRVLFVASECFPLVKTGGLADVVGALPLALAGKGCDVRVLIPAYPSVKEKLGETEELYYYADLFGGMAWLRRKDFGGLDLMVLDAPHLYERDGGPYTAPDGNDWGDNHRRFAALSWMAAEIGHLGIDGWRPDVVHAHDWQTGLTPIYLRNRHGARARTVFTIHNIAYQGSFDPATFPELGLPGHEFSHDGVEFYHRVGFLKGGLISADRLTTVSPTYAREIRTAEFGYGMEGVLRMRADALHGILNGVDEKIWDPKTDRLLAAPYSAFKPEGKAENKRVLQEILGLKADPDALLISVVSRLAYQKGLDVLPGLLESVAARGGQFVMLGSGDRHLENLYREIAAQHPGSIAVRIGYDEPLAHWIYAGADAILIPSRFEPCGLTQLYGLRYGAVPVVARTGGLADTIIDANEVALRDGVATGIQFAHVTAEALGFALERLFELYADKETWTALRKRGMCQQVGWDRSAEDYLDLYRSLVDSSAAG